MRTSRAWQAVAIAAIVAAAILFFLLRREPGPTDLNAMLMQVQQLNHLATVRYTVQKVVTLEEQKQPLGSERILLVVQAAVEAGVNLAGLQPRHIERRTDGTVVVHLPAPELLHVYVDDKETRVWDRQKTWWTPWVPFSRDLERQARIEGLEAVKKAALDMGILRQAEQNAEVSIRGLLTLAGIKNVVVIRASSS